VDSYDSATSRYSWTEQTFDATGGRIDKPGGRTGSTTYSPAYAFGDGSVVTDFPHPTTLTRRVVTATLGPVYEFPLYCACTAGGGSGGGFVITPCCPNPIPRTLYATVAGTPCTCVDGVIPLVYSVALDGWLGVGADNGCPGSGIGSHAITLQVFVQCVGPGGFIGVMGWHVHLSNPLSSQCVVGPSDTVVSAPCDPFSASVTGSITQFSASPPVLCGCDGTTLTISITE
jgi:hypothetical protein